MTSSNDNKDSALPHAASHLVLYTNVKREKKQQTKRRERAGGEKKEKGTGRKWNQRRGPGVGWGGVGCEWWFWV